MVEESKQTNSISSQPPLDPLKKREEFAVSLRRQKKQQIISSKRKRLLGSRVSESRAAAGLTNSVIEEDEAIMAEKINEATMSLMNLLTEQERELEPEIRIERLCETIKLMHRAS